MNTSTGQFGIETLRFEFFIRKSVLNHGLWEQLKVDCGSEFFLTLFIQEKLRQQFGSSEIAPYVQTPSTQVFGSAKLFAKMFS